MMFGLPLCVLPMGYKAYVSKFIWDGDAKKNYVPLLLLIILIIYTMCSIIFESLRLPLAVISMIPVSFVGVFLTFGLFHVPFGQGGFAAFVLL